MRRAAHISIIRDNKILLLLKKETWILPGGTKEEGEEDIGCLVRELEEELPGSQVRIGNFYNEFAAISPNKGTPITTRVYFGYLDGEVCSTASEIREFAWIGDVNKYNLADLTLKIVNGLKNDRYLI